MIFRSLVRVAAVIAAAVCLLPAQEPQQQVQAHFREAQKHLQNKRPDLAVGEFKAIVAIDPNNVDARGNLGVLEFFQGHYPNAVEQLRAALKINPSLWKLQALLGMSEKRTGDFLKAQSDLEAAFPHLDERKLQVQAGLELIEAEYSLRDLGRAAQTVNTLRQLEPTNPDILFTAHRIYSELSDETTLSLSMIAPDSARMHQLAAQELVRQDKEEAAIANYRIALKMEPQRGDLHYELAELLNGQRSAAAQAEAEKEYRAALANNPFDERAECRLGDIAFRRGDIKGAQTHYSKSLSLQPNDAEANFGLAKAFISLQQPQAAVRPLERAVELDPFNALTRYRLGVLYQKLGRADDARKQLAEFEKLKKMKSQLSELYQQIRLQPRTTVDADSEVAH